MTFASAFTKPPRLMHRGTLILMLCLLGFAAHARVTFVTVEAEGFGPRKSDAIADALVQAISQVNGAEVGGQTMRSLREESSESAKGNDYLLQESLQSQVSMKSKGLVKSWRTATETQDASTGLWTIRISAEISKYHESKQLKRLRMAVVPFRVDSRLGSSGSLAADAFSSALQDHLTQTRKFAMLDRSFNQEQNEELAKIKGGGFPTEELARLGNRAGTDYLIVGQVKEAITTETAVQSKLTGREIKVRRTQVGVSFRIVDVATTQLKFSDTVSGQGTDISATMLSKKLAQQASEKILNAIFPIRVIGMEGKQLTLAQGGDMLKAGQKMQLVKLGKPLIDPYTKESLGRQETVIGEVEVTQVQAKTSAAHVISSKLDYTSLNLIVRPVVDAQSERAAAEELKQVTEDGNSRMKSLQKDSKDEW